ncbi:putative bifunctional diguanylate cyclase/phosphodiesterase [Aromatoleum sp.]|uniref:putative bifunctional diguanylate cyclase/phosphodiesterase n=1 Tax=Aromatoleum sp. TaxID=2307007 RepID=UPI002FCAA671
MTTTSSAEALAAVGLDDADRAALRAFALAVPTPAFERAFACALDVRLPAPAAPTFAEAKFFGVLLERLQWTEAGWLDTLAGAWADCLRTGAGAMLPTRALSALTETARNTLADGEWPGGRAEWDILSAIEKLVQAASARLSGTTLEERSPHRESREGVDPATGLPTRQHFDALLQQALRHTGQDGVGLLLLHLDWGSSDQHLLTAQRERLGQMLGSGMGGILRPGDVLSAIGGHEWALLIPALRSAAQILLAARRLIDVCQRLIDSAFPQLRVRLHAGCAHAPVDGTDAEGLEHAARAALHSALRNDLEVATFRPEMVPAMEYERALERDIARSVDRPPFEIWLQPQVSLATGRCVSAEALLRWRRSEDEWVPPQQIVDIGGRLGLMPALTRWLITQVVRIIGELTAGGIDLRVALNLVAADLHDEDLPPLVFQTLAAWRVPAQKLCLEVTEGALIGDRERAAGIIEQLRHGGCSVALDDFGTGFSSLGYLRDLPVSELKIDQLFIRDMVDSERDRAIVTAVLALARGFGMSVVAEGVEDPRTVDALRRMGCDYVQGFHFARAMPQRELVDWIRAHNG